MATLQAEHSTVGKKFSIDLRRAKRWLVRSLMTLVILLGALAASGFVYQRIALVRDAQRFPAPGTMVEVDGIQLHLKITGEAGDGPSVILEAGSSGFSSQFYWLQKAVSEYSQVIAYDRMGLGWSEDGDMPHDAVSTAKRLHQALEKAGVEGPYILVGHSLGSFFNRAFADLYPDEVVGMVMIDVSHPDQREQFGPEMQKMQEDWNRMFRLGATLAPVGVPRLFLTESLRTMLAGLPDQQVAESLAFGADGRYMWATYEEMLAWDAMTQQVRETGDLGDMPLIVLSATEGMELPTQQEVMHGNHAELARLSTRGEHRLVEGATHFTIVMDRTAAQAAIDAIADVYAAAKGAVDGSVKSTVTR